MIEIAPSPARAAYEQLLAGIHRTKGRVACADIERQCDAFARGKIGNAYSEALYAKAVELSRAD